MTSAYRRRFLKAAPAVLVVATLPVSVHAASEGAGKLRIGIWGSGNIGAALGRIWANAGHEVMLSSLDLEHDKKLAASIGPNARAGTPREAAQFGDVILVAVPYRALPQIGKELADVYKGKVLIDAANPFEGRDGEVGVWARNKGAGLASAELLPGARIVRAFNAVGAARLPQIAQRPERPGMPIAGDDAKAIAVASRLIREVGFEPVLVGPLAMGKHLVPGTPLAGERSPEELRKAAATLIP